MGESLVFGLPRFESPIVENAHLAATTEGLKLNFFSRCCTIDECEVRKQGWSLVLTSRADVTRIPNKCYQ